MTEKEEMISKDEAAKWIELTYKRINLLHLSSARTIVNELGEERGRKLILKAIKDYGKRIDEKVREDVLALVPQNYGAAKTPDLPASGMHEKLEGKSRTTRSSMRDDDD